MTTLVWVALPLSLVTVIAVIWGFRMVQAKAAVQAELAAAKEAVQREETLRQQNEQQLKQLNVDKTALQADVSALQQEKVRWQEHKRYQDEKLAWLEEARKQLSQEFQQLAGKIFEERSAKLQQGNRDNIELLLKPFREQLASFRERVEKVHTEGSQNRAALIQQIKTLKETNLHMQEDARSLTRALRGENKTQGDWGEMILERLLEESGLQEGREYDTQSSHQSEEGRRLRPDVVVHLPDQKDIIIDSKVSLKAYEAYSQADDDEQRATALKRHLESVRNHVRELSDKDYRSLKSLHSLDFVLLFIPVEGAFIAAIQQDDALFSDAYQRNVVIVSPSTLLVTLRTIRNIWRYEDQNRNAMEIADQAGKICDQVTLLEEAWKDVGDRLTKANEAWQTGYKRLSSGRGNLLRRAHQLQELGAKAKKRLPTPDDAP